MKKIVFIMVALLMFFSVNAYAAQLGLFEIRNKISAESKQIKALLLESKDMVLISSMWDSCIMTMTQLDAYFYMVAIFNSVKQGDSREEITNYLTNWLKIIKDTSDLNIKSLSKVTGVLESRTKVYKEKLKNDFTELSKSLDVELGRISVLKKAEKLIKAR